MPDKQNQFYTSISKHYSEIFPYNPMQLQFVETKLGELGGKQILDIGCATGELASQLANSEANVVGIDLNNDLLKQAKSNKVHPKLTFQPGNMLDLEKDFATEQFDAVLCFGNTLVHLESKELVAEMLEAAKTVLNPGGQLLLQILNYDYIIGEQVSELPLIETENIKFVRKYKFPEDSSSILFQTDLEIKVESKTVSNETSLLAIKSGELVQLLESVSFKNIQLYANFKQKAFDGKHIPLVVSCEK